jgi:hypothetical protein
LLVSLLLIPGGAFADFFKWDVLVYPEGYGLTAETIPIGEAGVVWRSTDWDCEARDFWTNVTSEMLMEGKTLRCEHADGTVRDLTVICDRNNRGRRHNFYKEQMPAQIEGFHLNPENKVDSVFLQLRCYY